MKSPVQKLIDLDLSDGDIEKVLYETKSKFSLIKQLNLNATKSKFNHIECQYETAIAEASLQLKSVDSKIALERRRINQAIQNTKTDKKRSTNHQSWAPMEIVTDGKKFLQARRSHNKIEMEHTFLSPRGPKENRKDHKKRLFYEFDKMYTVENWKTTLGSHDDNHSDFLRGQPVQDFEKEIHKIVSRINHPSVKDPREILKSLLIPTPVPDHLLQQYQQTKKNKGDMLSKNASGIRLHANTIEVDMNIVDGEGGFRRIKHKFNPEKLQKKIIEKYSDFLTDKRYDTQTIVKKITTEYSKALGKINKNGLMVKVPKNFKVWMQNYNDFYHERAEDDKEDDYPDYLVQKQLDDYLDNKLNNEVDKTVDNISLYSSPKDLRKENSPKKRVVKKSTFPNQDGALNTSQQDEEEDGEYEDGDEEEYDEDTEEDFDQRMEKRKQQQLRNQQKRKTRVAAGEGEDEDEGDNEEEQEEGEDQEENDSEQGEENEQSDYEENEEGEHIAGRLETKKSQHSKKGGAEQQEEEDSEEEEDGGNHGKRIENSQRVMKKTEEERPPRKEYTYKERKTYVTVKKYEAIKLAPKIDPSQTPEAQRARQQEIEAEQKRMNDYYNERINTINSKYKDKNDVKSPSNKTPNIKKQNSKESQALNNSPLGTSAGLQKGRPTQNNPRKDDSPNDLKTSQISTKSGKVDLKQSQMSHNNPNSVASDDLEDNDRESLHEEEGRRLNIGSPSHAISTKSSGGGGGKKTTKSSSNKKSFNIDINSSSKKKGSKTSSSTKQQNLQLAKRSSVGDTFVGEEEHHEDYSPMQRSNLSVQPNHTSSSHSKSPKNKNRDRARTHNESNSTILKTEESPAQQHTTQLSTFSPRKHLEKENTSHTPTSQHHTSKSKGPQKNGVMNLKKDDASYHRYSLSPSMKPQITNGTIDEEEYHHRDKNKAQTAVKRVKSAKIKIPLPDREEEQKVEKTSSKYNRQSSVPHNEQINEDYHNVYNTVSPSNYHHHQRHHSSSSKLDRHRASVQPSISSSHANTPKSKYKQEARFSVGLVQSQSPSRKNENGLQASGMGYDFGNANKPDPNKNLRDRKQSHMSAVTLTISKNNSVNPSRENSVHNTRTSLYKKEPYVSTSKHARGSLLYTDAMKIVDTEFGSEIPVVGTRKSLIGDANSPQAKKSVFDLDKYMQDIKNQNAKRSTTIIDMLLAAPSVMDNDIQVLERPDYNIKVPQNLRFENEEYGTLFGQVYTWYQTIRNDVQDSDPDHLSELEDSVDDAEEEEEANEESTQRKEPESKSTKRDVTIESSDEETRRDESKFQKK